MTGAAADLAAGWLSPPIAALEQAAAEHWRAPDQEWLGPWLLRAGGGFTGRANSALPLGEPGRPLATAVAGVEAWYAARGLPAMIVIPGPLAPSGSAAAGAVTALDELLAARGWRIRSDAATVMTAAVAEVAAAADPVVPVTLADRPDDGWLGRYRYRGRDLPADALRLLLSAPWQAFASVLTGGQTAAVGRVSVAAGWAGITAVDVAPEHRRRGLGTAVTAALAAAAAGHAAGRIFLQVAEGNQAALGLYARCGFRAVHRYHYRVAP